MEFLIAGLLVVNLVAILAVSQFTERAIRRQGCKVDEKIAELTAEMKGIADILKPTREDVAQTVVAFRDLSATVSSQGEADMRCFSHIEKTFYELHELCARLEAMTPTADKEDRRSREIEEGISNLLQFHVGKKWERP